jgi:glycine/D-amino acid oxidase-like deaminating enzyme
MDQGYFYFRNVGNRVLFGGGRNLDKVAETTYSHQTSEIIQQKLETYLKETILPGIDFTIDQRWAGTLGLGKTRLPIIEKIDNNVFCAVRMGGMGVAIGSLVGKNVAELMAKN